VPEDGPGTEEADAGDDLRGHTSWVVGCESVGADKREEHRAETNAHVSA
jgi:hypothetical protein